MAFRPSDDGQKFDCLSGLLQENQRDKGTQKKSDFNDEFNFLEATFIELIEMSS